MELFLPSAVEVFIFCITVFAASIVYLIVNSPFNYWKKLGVPQIKVNNPILGNFWENFWTSFADLHEKAYYEFPEESFVGTYSGPMSRTPTVLVRDPDLVEAVLVRDFSHTSARGDTEDPNASEVSKHLFNLGGEEWRAMRNKLTPTFTSGKLKGMHTQLIDCSKSLLKYIEKFEDGRPFEIRDVIARFTVDVIASCAFGLTTDSINDPDSEFRAMGQQIFRPSPKFKIIGVMRILAPKLLWLYSMFDKATGSAVKFFVKAIEDTLDYRRKNNVVRQDFIHHLSEFEKKDIELIKMKLKEPNDPFIFDHKSLISNSFVFFLAGFETTASTISNTMYELALHPEIQERLHSEVVAVLKKHGDQLSYEAIQEMTYMDSVIAETLRKYPPLGFLARKLVKEYQLPGSDVILPVGTLVHVPIHQLHHDPQYYPDPEKFLPERFSDGKDTIRRGTYIPWSSGPRVCLGERFAKLEMKLCLTQILRRYEVVRCSKTVVPLKFETHVFIITPKDGIWLTIRRRNEEIQI